MAKYRVKLAFTFDAQDGEEIEVLANEGESLQEALDRLYEDGAYLGEPLEPSISDFRIIEQKEVQ